MTGHAELVAAAPVVARAVAVLVLPAEVVVLQRERIGIELVGLVAKLYVGGKTHRTRGQAEQLDRSSP